MQTIAFSEFHNHFRLIGQTILSTNRTYGFNLVITTDTDEIVIESAWKIFKGEKLFVDIKTNDYDYLEQMIDVLVSKRIIKILITDSDVFTLHIYFSEQFKMEIYLQNKYDLLWFNKLGTTDSYKLDYKKNFTFG